MLVCCLPLPAFFFNTFSELFPESADRARSPRYMVEPVTYKAAHCEVGEPRVYVSSARGIIFPPMSMLSLICIAEESSDDKVFTTSSACATILPVPFGSNTRLALLGDCKVDPTAVKSPNVAGTLVRLDPSPANAVAVTVPDTCNAVEGSEVPIPTREFVTSKYNKLVSIARSTPFLVRLDFSTDPDIRPMAILGTPL